jgi:hypothetical protein
VAISRRKRLWYKEAVSEINIRRDGFHLTLVVAGYERDRRGESYDDNWLRGTALLDVAQPRTATFKAQCDVAWQTTDLERFQESLRTLLDDLTGVATLSMVEDQVELTIRLTSGKGTVEGRVEAHAVASLEFEANTDQRFLAQNTGRAQAGQRDVSLPALAAFA